MLAYEFSGGPVRPNKSLYVGRNSDEQFHRAVVEKRDVFIITAPRQTGKTSLWFNALDHLRAHGFNTSLLDFRVVLGQPEENTRAAKGWTDTLLRATARRFDLDIQDLGHWIEANSKRSTTEQIVDFFKDFLRSRLKGPIIIAFDEIDVVQLYHYFTDNFFEAIRALAVERDALDLSFVMIGLNHPKDLLKTTPAGGFNISGLHISLEDFNPDDAPTVTAWADAYPIAGADRLAIAKAALTATGGQPFLTARLLEDARKSGVREEREFAPVVERLLEDAKDGKGAVGAHFASARDIVSERPNLSFRMLDVIERSRGTPVPIATLRGEVRAALVSTGLLRERNRAFIMKSPIYKDFFDDQWIADLKASIGTDVPARAAFGSVGQSGEKKRVCIINTGGMISMELQPDGRIGAPHDLTAHFRAFPELFEIADFAAVPLMSKDSSDMNPDDWSAIANTIYQRRDQGFNGFVVVHGTDTLPYTASAVAYALGGNLSFPVVFVGSQTAPHVIHGDARINLMRACTLATYGKDIPEVVAVIDDQIHRAVRVEKRDDFRFDGMHSPTFEPLGLIADRIEIKKSLIRKLPRLGPDIDLRNEFSHHVLKIGVYPGLDADFLRPVLDNPKLEGVIIETLGIGNIPIEGKWSLIPFIEQATTNDIPVLLVSQFPIQPELTAKYEPASAPLAAGAIGAANMAPPAAVTKFMWVLAQIAQKKLSGLDKRDEVRKWMNIDFVGEVGSGATEQG